MTRRTIVLVVLLASLAGLVWFSSHLAALRIYQVDECQNMYMARVLATGQSKEFFTNGSLFLLGPLSWITRNAVRSSDAFDLARLLFLGVFWLNFFLLALITGGRAASSKTLVALLLGATLAPLWDYGFEIRHDSLVVTGVLLTWWAVRVRPMGLMSYAAAGAIAMACLFVAVKSVVYVLPLSLFILLFPPPAFSAPRYRLALAWLIGVIGATALIRVAYGQGGGWEIYLSVFQYVLHFSAGMKGGGTGFSPLATLARLLGQTPLLLIVVLGGCFAVVNEAVRRGRAVLSWDGLFPEFLLVAGALAALALNPTPYAYNLINVVPYAFLFGFRYAESVWSELWSRPALRSMVASTVIFAHVVPFAVATHRHVEMLNWRQGRLMTLAEDLTDPCKDAVYDGVGMVLTRPTTQYRWYLHSLNIQDFLDGSGPHVRDLLAARPPAVIIQNYRFDWLAEEDHTFITNRYVPLADDFWVLGSLLPEGGGTFEVHHRGRYRISTAQGSDLDGTYEVSMKSLVTPEDSGVIEAKIDGVTVGSRPIELCEGTHTLECARTYRPAVVWVGPRRDRIHRIGPGNHRQLFVNWY